MTLVRFALPDAALPFNPPLGLWLGSDLHTAGYKPTLSGSEANTLPTGSRETYSRLQAGVRSE